jgi:hypothetical protein
MPAPAAAQSQRSAADLNVEVLSALAQLHKNTGALVAGLEGAGTEHLTEVLGLLNAANGTLSGEPPKVVTFSELQAKEGEILARAQAFKNQHIESTSHGSIAMTLAWRSIEDVLADAVTVAKELGVPGADSYRRLYENHPSELEGSTQIPAGDVQFEVTGVAEQTRGRHFATQVSILAQEGLLVPKLRVIGLAHLAYAIANVGGDADLFKGQVVKFDTGLLSLGDVRGFSITGGIQRGFEDAPACSLKIIQN